jgi:hypothetical protein
MFIHLLHQRGLHQRRSQPQHGQRGADGRVRGGEHWRETALLAG